MKLYVIAGLLSLVILYMWWDGRTKYQAGYNAAEVKYVKAINKSNAEAKEKRAVLTRQYTKEMKDAKQTYRQRIAVLRSAKDPCLTTLVPPAYAERLRDERDARDQRGRGSPAQP